MTKFIVCMRTKSENGVLAMDNSRTEPGSAANSFFNEYKSEERVFVELHIMSFMLKWGLKENGTFARRQSFL